MLRRLVEILLEFKWKGFAQRKYIVELVLYLVHVIIIFAWNIISQQVIEYYIACKAEGYAQGLSAGEMVDMFTNEHAEIDGVVNGCRDSERPTFWTFVILALLWCWTTLMCLIFIRLQILEICYVGWTFFRDPWNFLEAAYVVFQIMVNILFLLHQEVAGSVWQMGVVEAYNATDFAMAAGRRLAEEHMVAGLDMAFSLAAFEDEVPFDGFLPEHVAGRILRGSGGSSATGGLTAAAMYPYGVPTGNRAGAYVILQSLVALSTWIRLLYYFKGILRLGTLVHTLQRIFLDIYPLLVLIIVLFIAFWSSMWMLINVELVDECARTKRHRALRRGRHAHSRAAPPPPTSTAKLRPSPFASLCLLRYSYEWRNMFWSAIKLLNMGLYTDMDSKMTSYRRDPLLAVLYELYMFLVQIILLNMLIALMAESNERVRSIAKLVAQFERAKLILQWERRLSDLPYSTSYTARLVRLMSGLPSGRGRGAASEIFPRWLHVLLPADHSKGEMEGKTPEKIMAAKLEETKASLLESHGKITKAVATSQEETKRLSTLIVETQERHSNLLREMQREMAALRSGSPGDAKRPSSHRRGSVTASSSGQAPSDAFQLRAQTSSVTLVGSEGPPSEARSDSALLSQNGPFTWFGGFFSPSEREEEEREVALSERVSSKVDEKPKAKMAVTLEPVPAAAGTVPKVTMSTTPPLTAEAEAPPKAKVSVTFHFQRLSRRFPRRPSRFPSPRSQRIPPLPSHSQPNGPPKPMLKLRAADANEELQTGVPIPPPLAHPEAVPSDPAAVLHQMRQACGAPRADLELARKIASQLRDASYTLRNFHDDIVTAFPEVRYYFVEDVKERRRRAREHAQLHDGQRVNPFGENTTEFTSGVGGGETEYLRTMGAFFAIYWLSRLGMDGERGFSFGVEEGSPSWTPMCEDELQGSFTKQAPSLMGKALAKNGSKGSADSMALDPQQVFFSMNTSERALAFYRSTDWPKLGALMVDAGLLVAHAKLRKGADAYRVCVERMAGLLALTAIHDIMKVDSLLPTVQPQHAPYCGFLSGDRINDHDVALGYILEHFGGALPSYAGMPEDLQHTIRFTQVRLAFNHGWLVQAEAPPGPLMTQFKRVITSDKGISKADISFYFVHWLTDLAGAEPTPLKGSEKFVLRFPHPVLHSFIASFSIVGTLVEQTETHVFEEQLRSKWNESASSLGPPPQGRHAIALLRLVAQVQHLPLQQRLLTEWPKLSDEDAAVLSFEMALTGCPGQNYDVHKTRQGGPVFLIYYSPAFLRMAARQDAASGLRMLAEVYRQSRALWPYSEADAHLHVTIRIDQIKEHTPQHIMDGYLWGEGWLIVKHNEREAVVEHHPLYSLQTVHGQDYRVLAFWRLSGSSGVTETEAAFIQELEEMRREMMNNAEASVPVGGLRASTNEPSSGMSITFKGRANKKGAEKGSPPMLRAPSAVKEANSKTEEHLKC